MANGGSASDVRVSKNALGVLSVKYRARIVVQYSHRRQIRPEPVPRAWTVKRRLWCPALKRLRVSSGRGHKGHAKRQPLLLHEKSSKS